MYEGFILFLQSDGLTFREIIGDIPHNFGALIVYLLIGAFAFLTWYGSRKETVGRYAPPQNANPGPGTLPHAESDADRKAG